MKYVRLNGAVFGYDGDQADLYVAAIEAGGIDISEDWPPDVVAPSVPRRVTMRQARLALHQQGLLDQVETAMQSADKTAQIEWEYADGVEMDSPLVASMRDALGLTDDDVLGLFAIAGGL